MIVITAHASVLDVTLVRINEVAQNFKFSPKNALFSQYMCNNSFRDDFKRYGKMADIAKNAVYVPSFRV